MSQPTTLRTCPDCRASNPARLTHCYACGQSLDKRPSGTPLPGERSYPCLNCGGQIAYAASSCPTCGRLATPPESPTTPTGLADAVGRATLAPMPMDWEVEPLPDGTVRLRKSGWGRLLTDQSGWWLAPLVLYLLFGILMNQGRYRSPSYRHNADPTMVMIFYGVLAVIGITALLWALLGKEELRVGPDFLEIRKRFLRFESVRRINGMSFLMISTYTTGYGSRSGPRTTRSLHVQSHGKRICLDSHSRAENSLFSELSRDIPDNIASLGRYLAAQTGWPLTDHR